jgi:hypothetical protein
VFYNQAWHLSKAQDIQRILLASYIACGNASLW